MAQHGKKYNAAPKRLTAKRFTARKKRSSSPKKSLRPSSTKPSNCTCAWASIPATAISRSATTVLLPNGLGKTVRVLVFAEGEAATYRPGSRRGFRG